MSESYWPAAVLADIDELAGFWLFQAVTGRDWESWRHFGPGTKLAWQGRAVGNLDFIPSYSRLRDNLDQGGVTSVVQTMPPPEVPVRIITPNETLYEREVPGAAKQMVKRLAKHGWTFDVRYCVGPWTKKAERIERTETIVDKDGELAETVVVEEKIIYGQAPSVVLRFHRGEQRGFAMWLAKPWTKDGDKLKFWTAQVRPYLGKLKSDELIKVVTAPAQGGNA